MKNIRNRVGAALDHPIFRGIRRAIRLLLLTLAIVVAVVLVTSVTIDLGDVDIWGRNVRKYAEEEGRKYLKRPLHIGRISFRLYTGDFVIEDVRIEGKDSESRPFLTARRIDVSMPWSTLFDRRIVIRSIEMTDWKIYVETLPDGRNSMPKLTPDSTRTGKSSWTTTTEWIRAHRGEFTFQDHGTPWLVITRNLDVTVARPGTEYRGTASFSNGTVAIQNYVPFRADMESAFKIDGTRVVLNRISLITDGARSSIHGDVNLKYWPEQMFRVESEIDYKRMRELFFANEPFRVAGTGRFEGYFHLFKETLPNGTNRTGRQLTGTFTGPNVAVNQYHFTDLRGSVRWTPEKLAVTDATAALHGGRARFGYEMSPLGVRGVRPTARFNTTYDGLSLASLTEFAQLDGLRLAGQASGRLDLQWPLGRFAARHIDGTLQLTPPAGVSLMERRVPVELIDAGRLPRGPAAPLTPLVTLPVGATLAFSSTPGEIVFGPSVVRTPRTYVEFEGQTTTSGERSRLPFFVASADWQESYDVFAVMMTALGSRTTTIDISGFGTFDGELTNDVRRPRIEGTFSAERMRAWNQEWGSARGRAVIENGYADVRDTTVTAGDSTIAADGRFSLGFPRKDGGEELNARVRIERRPLADLRHAFALDRYPVDGLLSGEFHVFGNYRRPLGYGEMTLRDGQAYGETFASATAAVSLEGIGVRLTDIDVKKSTGRGSGSVYVDWDGAYSFNFAASAIPIEDVALTAKAPLPLSGLIDFTAQGSGTFDNPRYAVNGRIRDFFAADEGIGQLVGDLTITGNTMGVVAKVASPRLAVSVEGQIELEGSMHSDLTVLITDTSLDPYLRALDPRLSPYTTAVIDASITVKGELTNLDALAIDTRIDRLDLRLFDYPLKNASPFSIAFDRNAVTVPQMTLFGENTKLEISGRVSLASEEIEMNARGDADLALLQGFVSNVRSSGKASLSAAVTGALRDPDVNGTLRIDNGRVRHFDAPHAVEAITGVIAFDSLGVTLDAEPGVPGVTAKIGDGPVQLGGRIEIVGYLPGRLDLTLAGQNMRLRYPTGMKSVVDADLTLQGTIDNMRLAGDVRIGSALYDRDFPSPSDLFRYLTGETAVTGPPGPGIPLTYDGIHVVATSSLRVDNRGDTSARLSSSADLELRGTYARPEVSGALELDPGGEFRFLGKRYTVTQGTVDFVNPDSIQPTFDIEGETRVRAPGETYRITVNVRGALGRAGTPPRVSFSSDPSLSSVEIMALLFGDVAPGQDVELTRLQRDSAREQQILQEVLARTVATEYSSPVNTIFSRTFRVDTVQITPSLTNPDPLSSRLEPCARLLLGKRLSTSTYLTYTRSLCSSTRDEIILFEYDATDRLSWVLSRNEDQTYAIEVRVRHAF